MPSPQGPNGRLPREAVRRVRRAVGSCGRLGAAELEKAVRPMHEANVWICRGRGLLMACLATVAVGAEEQRRPNIVLIVADDLGYADVGFHGVDDIPTPSLDALARRGVRFTNGYVSGTWCSPSRAGFLTGRYQQRFGESGHEASVEGALSLDETTLAERLQSAGYVTGLVGKWHLGLEPEFHPLERGFDEFFGFLRGGHNFLPDVPSIIFPDHEGHGEDLGATEEGRAHLNRQILRGTEPVAEEGYLTDAIGREAAAFVQRHEAEPFFLFVSFNAVHTPMQATERRLRAFANVSHPVRRVYNAMMLALDEAVGALFAQLDRSGLLEDTLVFFLSDNGGPTLHRYAYNASDNTPLRGSKGTTLEAGIRVPFVLSWPRGLPSGTRFDEPVIALDLVPTALAAAGVEIEDEWELDGVDLLPYLHGDVSGRPHEALFWRSWGQMAVRRGDWKLVSYVAKMDEGELLRGEPRDEMTPYRLYNLRRDIGESEDLAAAEPQRAARLLALWRQWNAEMRPVP